LNGYSYGYLKFILHFNAFEEIGNYISKDIKIILGKEVAGWSKDLGGIENILRFL
jgi:hypothetical protein